MRVHPAAAPNNNPNMMVSALISEPARQKKLRRLPHIFAKVLELPFNSDTDVFVQETSDSFRFVVGTTADVVAVTPHLVEIYHGVTKLVITDHISAIGGFMELDMWRFRLPAYTRPDLATAGYCNGELVVIVPKDSAGINIVQTWVLAL